MKRLLSIALLVLLLIPSGCGNGRNWWEKLEGNEAALQEAAYQGEVNRLEGVTMTLSEITPTGVEIVFLNTRDTTATYGAAFQIQRLVDRYWVPVPDGPDGWDEWGRYLPQGQEERYKEDWTHSYGGVAAGHIPDTKERLLCS